MLEWTCYTEYGSPSGHSMLSIVLLEFLVRFMTRKIKCAARFNYLWYTLVFLLELLVMFSRVYLGMHSLNQVLFGMMLGCYSMVVYYLYAEHWLFTHCLRYLTQGTGNIFNFLVCSLAFIAMCLYQCFITYFGTFDIPQSWVNTINLTPRCAKSYDFATSFYLKCFEDMAIGVVAPAIMVALSISTNGSGLMKKLNYSRCCSGKFVGYVGLTLVSAAIPAAIFLNPFWKQFDLPADSMAGLLWSMNALGFTISMIVLVAISPRLIAKCGLAEYAHLDSYTAFKQ
ncbi:MAG: phosphatase PAP2 family protein [Actinobacteria bacterium]|nr:phosphatase PAP2 family protein [Actinomycetota bacterium]